MWGNNPSLDLQLECGVEAFSALHPGLQEAISEAARRYRLAEFNAPKWVITSGRRTLRRQAELMAALSPEQLVAMYCSHGRPQYIDALLELNSITPEAAYQVLCNRSEGYISRHLFGAAADIAAHNITNPARLKALLLEQGAAVLDEREMGILCYHVSWPDAPVKIIRE